MFPVKTVGADSVCYTSYLVTIKVSWYVFTWSYTRGEVRRLTFEGPGHLRNVSDFVLDEFLI